MTDAQRGPGGDKGAGKPSSVGRTKDVRMGGELHFLRSSAIFHVGSGRGFSWLRTLEQIPRLLLESGLNSSNASVCPYLMEGE